MARRTATLAVPLALLALAGLVHAGDATPADLARALRKGLEELHEVRAGRRAEDAAHRARLEVVAREIERLDADAAALEREVAAERARLEGLRTERADLRARAGALEGDLRQAAAAGAPVAERLGARIRAGIPARRDERAARFEAAARVLAALDPLRVGDGLAEIHAAAGEELRLARAIETRNEPVAIGDRRVHAYRLRFGLAAEGFLAEDGSDAALFDPRAGRWRHELEPGQRTALETAFEILAGRRAPEIAPFPFPVAPKDAP